MNRRAKVIAALLLGLVFVIGGLTGMVLEEALGLDWFEFLDEDDRTAPDQLLAGLDLTPEQRGRAEAILERQEDSLERYWQGRIPEIRRMLDESYAEIRALLSPAQQSAFDRRVGELEGRVPGEILD